MNPSVCVGDGTRSKGSKLARYDVFCRFSNSEPLLIDALVGV